MVVPLLQVVLCPRRDPHDWEKCVYAHRGEKARRRHPSKYQAVQCPEARAVSWMGPHALCNFQLGPELVG
jgi:hypothetical protein